MLVAQCVEASFASEYSAGHAWESHMADDSQQRVRGLISPTRNGLGFGEARSG